MSRALRRLEGGRKMRTREETECREEEGRKVEEDKLGL